MPETKMDWLVDEIDPACCQCEAKVLIKRNTNLISMELSGSDCSLAANSN